MAQALGVVAVDLDIAVKGFHHGGTVKGVVAVPGLIVCQQVACMVITEESGCAVFSVGSQPVARVILIKLLHTLGNAPGAVACLVVEQLFGITGVLHLLQLVQRVVVVECLISKLFFVGTVAVAIVEVTVVGQNRVARLDKKAGQVLVLVVVILFEHGAVLLLADGAIRIIIRFI